MAQKYKSKYKPRAVEVTVLRLIDGDHPIAGRAYASFLSRLVRLLDARYGKAPSRIKRRLANQQKLTSTISTIIQAHPEWTYNQVADAAGTHPNTVRKIDFRVREKYSLGKKSRGRKPQKEQTIT